MSEDERQDLAKGPTISEKVKFDRGQPAAADQWKQEKYCLAAAAVWKSVLNPHWKATS